MIPEESSSQSSRQHSPSHPSSGGAQPTDAVLHRVKTDQGDATTSAMTRDHREQKSAVQQRPSDQKSSRTKTAKSAEKPGGKAEKHSSRHRSSSLKHKPSSSGSSKHQSSSKM